MPFTIKDWQNGRNGSTKLDADALKDIEGRLSNYTDSSISNAVSGAITMLSASITTVSNATDAAQASADAAQSTATTAVSSAAAAATSASTAQAQAAAAADLAANAAAQAAAAAAQVIIVRGQNLPTGALGASVFDRASVVTANITAPPTSARLHFVRIPVYPGDVITNVSWLTGTTGGSGLTNSWACLYDLSLNKLRVSADNTSATWTSETARTFTLASTYTVPSGVTAIYAGLCIVGTTMPNLAGVASQTTGSSTLAPIASFAGTAGLTNPASAPATTTQASSNKIPYCWLT